MEIIKVKEWLKFRHPDYDGFIDHIRAWDKEGISYGFKDLLRISEAYHIKPPKVINGKLIFND